MRVQLPALPSLLQDFELTVEPVRVEDERSSDQVAGVEGLEDGEDVFQWLISPVSTETFYEAIHGGAGWRGGACVCENVGSEGVSQECTGRNEAASPAACSSLAFRPSSFAASRGADDEPLLITRPNNRAYFGGLFSKEGARNGCVIVTHHPWFT